MGRDIDEDLIEATIRRIAESKAARLDPGESDTTDGEPAAPGLRLVSTNEFEPADEDAPTDAPAPPRVEESVIEATLRRIKTQQAVRAAESSGDGDEGDGDEPEGGTIEPVARVAEAPRASAGAGRPAVDESLIEATLRRIELQQAARDDEAPPPVTPEVAPGTATPDTGRRSIAGKPPRGESAPDGSWLQAATELRQELEEMQTAMRSLTERVDALVAQGPQPKRRATARGGSATSLVSDSPVTLIEDEWDDTPQLPRIPLGTLPPRGVVFDPSPATATAAQLEYAGEEAQPAPAPQTIAEPVAAAPSAKHGFDLLPRAYRITVEDKRRGVDLVPLHRALLGMDGVREMSLLSYSNGTAIVALETTTEILPDALGAAVAHAMSREVKVEVHNEQTMVIKLGED